MDKTYTQLRELLTRIGVVFADSGPASENLGRQVNIRIFDEQGYQVAVWLYWDIDAEGNEKYVCQE